MTKLFLIQTQELSLWSPVNSLCFRHQKSLDIHLVVSEMSSERKEKSALNTNSKVKPLQRCYRHDSDLLMRVIYPLSPRSLSFYLHYRHQQVTWWTTSVQLKCVLEIRVFCHRVQCWSVNNSSFNAPHVDVAVHFFFDCVFTRTKSPTVGARPLARQPDVAQECGQTVWCLQTFVFALSGIGGEWFH